MIILAVPPGGVENGVRCFDRGTESHCWVDVFLGGKEANDLHFGECKEVDDIERRFGKLSG